MKTFVQIATGLDGISRRLLRETAHQIAPSLSQLFNKSLSSGSLPDEWKLANITPVFKKGDQHYVENYRPVSLICCISKVVERCVLSKLRDHLLTLIKRRFFTESRIVRSKPIRSHGLKHAFTRWRRASFEESF